MNNISIAEQCMIALERELNTMQSCIESYPTPSEALSAVINWNVQIATDPAVNGGKVLVPVEPEITNVMKAKCMGEFSVKFPEECFDCEGQGCHVCEGTGQHTRQINVPWAVMKDIFKSMYKAMLSAGKVVSEMNDSDKQAERVRKLEEALGAAMAVIENLLDGIRAVASLETATHTKAGASFKDIQRAWMTINPAVAEANALIETGKGGECNDRL